MIELVQFLAGIGYTVSTVIPDGIVHRFPKNKNDRKDSAWYIAHQNHTRTGELFHVIIASDWASDDQPHKYHTIKGKLSNEDKKYIDRQMNEAMKIANAEKEKAHRETAEECEKKWFSLGETGSSSYLDVKGVSGCPNMGIRFDGFDSFVIPVSDINGKIWSLQTVSNKMKKFESGGRVKDNFHRIGKESDTVVICEGFATGASIHMATGLEVIVAFNAGGLRAVAPLIRKKVGFDKKIIIAGDDDRSKEKNVGRLSAEEAARLCGGVAVFPDFSDPDTLGKDFNDMHLSDGLDAVAAIFEEKTAISTVDQPVNELMVINTPFPDMSMGSNPKPLGTIRNVEELLRRLRWIVRYNIIGKEEEILIPGVNFSQDNKLNASLARVTDWCARVSIPQTNLTGYLTAIADQNLYNPVATWIGSKPWDGEDRLEAFFDTVKTPPGSVELKRILMKRWMLSAIAAAFEPEGLSSHGVLCFQGPQELGKTSWFKSLVPAELKLIKDGFILKTHDTDSVKQAISYWLIELGELELTLKKSGVAAMKSFLTCDSDVMRNKYDRRGSRYARRTVFFGSVNPKIFLNDPTGNRRYWTVECIALNAKHGIDMQQLWAQIYLLYKSGEPWILQPNESILLNANNKDFESTDPIYELLVSALSWEDPECMWHWKSCTDILNDAMGITRFTMIHKKPELNAVGDAVRKLNGGKSRRTGAERQLLAPSRKR